MTTENNHDIYDLVVVGFGAAGLSTAVSYLEATAERPDNPRIAIIERSKKEDRGGATRWTGAFLRINQQRQLDTNYGSKLSEVSNGLVDDAYCKVLAEKTPETIEFIENHGVKVVFEDFPLPHTFDAGQPSMTPPASPRGGGLSIVENLGSVLDNNERTDIHYETEALRLTTDADGRINGLLVRNLDGTTTSLKSKAVVLASGGFQGNPQILTQYIGERASELPLIAPGIANNRGDALRMATELGADTAGQFDGIHAEPVDTRTSKADSVLYGFSTGIFLNGDLQRFIDEGQDTWDNTFEKVGYEIWKNQGQEAYWIADAKTLEISGIYNSLLSDVPPEQADSLADLALKLNIDPSKLQATVDEFNASTNDLAFDPTHLDGKSTSGATPPKSNWAVPLDTPPFIGVPVTAAICFTYGGIRTNLNAQVVTPNGTPIPGLYAAGEATGLYYNEYPPATSVLRSLVFGRISAQHIAHYLAPQLAVL